MTETTEALPRHSGLVPDTSGKSPTGKSGFGKSTWGESHLCSPLVATVILVGVMVVLRVLVASHMELETDEAYYWLWSRRLAESYFDHPPMIAYMIRLGTVLFGDTVFGIRSMAIASIIATSALLYALTVILFDDRRLGALATLWFNLMPHTAFFSIVMYPDTPAILFWVQCCVALALVWKTGRGAWWYVAGVAGGCLLLSKYTGVFLLAGVGLWLLLSPQMRHWLKRPEPYLAALIALLLFSPVIQWNADHHWASFAKQFGRALDSTADGGLANMGAFLGIQTIFVSPLIFIFAIAGLGVATTRGFLRQEANWLLLAASVVPMLLYFLLHALSAEVLPQWPSAAYAIGVVAAVAAFATRDKMPEHAPLIRYGFAAAPWLGLAMTLLLLAQMTVRPVQVPAARDPLNIFSGWAQLAADTRAVAKAHDVGYIANADYDIGAELAFYLRDIPVFQTSEAIRYEYRPSIDQALLARSTGIYVAMEPYSDLPKVEKHFDSVVLIATIWRTRNGDPIKPYRIYELKGYRGGIPY